MCGSFLGRKSQETGSRLRARSATDKTYAKIKIMKDPEYVPTIGLEIHAEIKTESKMFCSCKNDPDESRPNVNICPICLGHPGTLPVVNIRAVENVLRIGMAVNGTLADFTEWDRKHYFYPDIPKGYQISQYAHPLVVGGVLSGVGLTRIHLEEDTARSTHDTHDHSLIDFNRSGIPLMEAVTEPVIHSSQSAVVFAKEFQLLLRTLGIGSANLEKGEMRIEANVSVAKGEEEGRRKKELGRNKNTNVIPHTSLFIIPFSSLGTKIEIKNLNSFRAVGAAIEYEIARQIKVLEGGDKVIQETRGWDEVRQETYSQRSKESSPDYRYFPDPDIPKFFISSIPEFSPEILSQNMPEFPWIRRERYKKDFSMTDKEITMFVEDPSLAEYFENIIVSFKDDPRKIKLTVNYLLTDYLGMVMDTLSAVSAHLRQGYGGQAGGEATLPSEALSEGGGPPRGNGLNRKIFTHTNPIPVTYFSTLITMIAEGQLSSRGAKDALALMIKNPDQDPKTIAQKHGLLQKSSVEDIAPIIEMVIKENPQVVDTYKSGKTASLQYLIGQAMKVSGGSADPDIVKKLLIERMS